MTYKRSACEKIEEGQFRGVTENSIVSSLESCYSEIISNFEDDFGLPLKGVITTFVGTFGKNETRVLDLYHPNHENDYYHFLIEIDRLSKTSMVTVYVAGKSKKLGAAYKRENIQKWANSKSDDWTGMTDMVKDISKVINFSKKVVSKLNGDDELAQSEEKYYGMLIQCIKESIGL